MTGVVAGVCAVLGLAVGSFCNVVIWRVPRRESIVTPASHCPSCDVAIAPRDNVPVASWVLLKGRCRHCGTGIPARYPLVELLTAALFAAVGARLAGSWTLPAYLVFTAGLIVLAFIDLDTMLLPNRVLYPVGACSVPLLALGAWLDDDVDGLVRALLGGAAAFAFFLVVFLVSPRSMGFGDVRLSALLGIFLGYLGWGYVFFGLFAGFCYGAVVGLSLMAAGRHRRRQPIPFGPFLVAGALTFVLAGAPVLDWYGNLGA